MISNWASGSFHLLLLASNLDGHSFFHWRSNPFPQWLAKVTIYPVYAFGLIVAALLTSQGPPPWVLVLQVSLGGIGFANQGRTSKVPVMDNHLDPLAAESLFFPSFSYLCLRQTKTWRYHDLILFLLELSLHLWDTRPTILGDTNQQKKAWLLQAWIPVITEWGLQMQCLSWSLGVMSSRLRAKRMTWSWGAGSCPAWCSTGPSFPISSGGWDVEWQNFTELPQPWK